MCTLFGTVIARAAAGSAAAANCSASAAATHHVGVVVLLSTISVVQLKSQEEHLYQWSRNLNQRPIIGE